jgi:hypothetical protein
VQLSPMATKTKFMLIISKSLVSSSVHIRQWVLDKYLLNECSICLLLR